MRKRQRKMLVHNNSSFYSRKMKRELLRNEYATDYNFFKNNHICKLLWGKCIVFEGIESTGWYPRKTDLIVTTEAFLTRKEIKRLNIIACELGKELFVVFNWGPKGPAIQVFIIALKLITEEILKILLHMLVKEKKLLRAKNIYIKNENGKTILVIIDENEKVFEIIIEEKCIDLEQKIEKTMTELNIPYRKIPKEKSALIYDRTGSKINYKEVDLFIDLSV